MNAAKKIILLLWLLLAASLGNVSALTPGTAETCVWQKSLAPLATRQAGPLQTAGGHQENEGAGYDYVSASLLAAEGTAAEQGGLNLFKFGDSTSTTASGWSQGDYFLNLPNQGSPAANWAQNSSALRSVMSEGNPIYDSYIDAATGQQIPTTGFLNAERNLLENQGWTFSPQTGAYHPPVVP